LLKCHDFVTNDVGFVTNVVLHAVFKGVAVVVDAVVVFFKEMSYSR
jgi:hypothetical protein